jgi:undecaprenyl diphosphate synthase
MSDNPAEINNAEKLPRHIAVIMDGNGRWAKRQLKARFFGHRAGVEAVRAMVRGCSSRGIEVLTLFAFSSENWRRPKKEVSLLMDLFISSLQKEIDNLHRNNIRMLFIGDRSPFSSKLQTCMAEAEQLTADNAGLKLVIAVNYGGRWDIAQAARALAEKVSAGEIKAEEVDADLLQSHLSLSGLPEPDLFIRTGGEQRISNFLLWQLAYAELYFTQTLWPAFDENALRAALDWYATRQRRFGMTGDQIEKIEKTQRA